MDSKVVAMVVAVAKAKGGRLAVGLAAGGLAVC